jgi:hypothetical protein
MRRADRSSPIRPNGEILVFLPEIVVGFAVTNSGIGWERGCWSFSEG